jgi:uncharacterized protein YidB (DUF937 family)
MALRTFKIGEYCKGGVITVLTKKNTVTIIGKEWDYSQGTRKSSSQKNAQEFTRLTVDASQTREISDFLHTLTTSGYTEKIMSWISEKV